MKLSAEELHAKTRPDLGGWLAEDLLARRRVLVATQAYAEGSLPPDDHLDVDVALIEALAGRGIDELWFDDTLEVEGTAHRLCRWLDYSLMDVHRALSPLIGYPEVEALVLRLEEVPLTEEDQLELAAAFASPPGHQDGIPVPLEDWPVIRRIFGEAGLNRFTVRLVTKGPPARLRGHRRPRIT